MHVWTIVNLIFGLGFVLCGAIYRFRTPRFNAKYSGIALPFVRKNPEIWNEAHKYSSGPIIVIGIAIVLMALLFNRFQIQRQGTGFIIAGIVFAMILTKRHIDKNFDENGNRRH